MPPTKVKVTFIYVPDEPDPDHAVGMSDEEYQRLYAQLDAVGADDIEIEQVEG